MRRVLIVGGVVFLGGLALSLQWVKINVSPSIPLGLYRLHTLPSTVEVGMIVMVSIDGWSAPTRPFLKPIAEAEGGTVCRNGDRLMIRGEDYGVIHDTWGGRLLPTSVDDEGCVTIQPGYVFLATKVPTSLDSRYYGPIPIAHLSAMATPLITWGPEYP